MDCPDPLCRESLLKCINKKVSKMVLLSVMSAVIAFSGGFILYAMDANQNQRNKISNNEKSIAVLEKDLEHIKASQAEIKETVKRIENNQITKADMIKIIEKIQGK